MFAAFRVFREKGNSEMKNSAILIFSQAARIALLCLEARIQRLEDIQEIRDLLTSYGRLLDAHDLAGYSRLFAKNGEWVGGFGSAKVPRPSKP